MSYRNLYLSVLDCQGPYLSWSLSVFDCVSVRTSCSTGVSSCGMILARDNSSVKSLTLGDIGCSICIFGLIMASIRDSSSCANVQVLHEQIVCSS